MRHGLRTYTAANRQTGYGQPQENLRQPGKPKLDTYAKSDHARLYKYPGRSWQVKRLIVERTVASGTTNATKFQMLMILRHVQKDVFV